MRITRRPQRKQRPQRKTRPLRTGTNGFASFAIFAIFAFLTAAVVPQSRPRARDLGIAPGVLAPGPLNAITDVDGVRVGHTTVVEGDTVRTGVTAILPHAGNLFQD